MLALLALDLGVFHRKAHEVRVREALVWSARLDRARARLQRLVVYSASAPERGLEFLTGYLIEKALSVDNIFVFFVIFSYFAVPAAYQHRVLFWGILGALVMRAVFIVARRGAAPALPLGRSTSSARFLVLTGVKLLLQQRGRASIRSGTRSYRLVRGG